MSSRSDFISETRDFWQKRTAGEVTDEDARQMVENVVGFFDLLIKWENSSKGKSQSCSISDFSEEVRDASTKGS